MNRDIKIYAPQLKKMIKVGEVIGDTFVKKVHSTTHRMFTPPGWAHDANSWDNDIRKDPAVKFFLIVDEDTGRNYWVTVATFGKYCIATDRGAGLQYELTLDRWSSTKPANQGELL